MKSSTASRILFIVSGLMSLVAAGEIAFALFTNEDLPILSDIMIFLTLVNATLFFIIGLNFKEKAKKEECNR